MCLLTLEDCKEYDSIDYKNITLHFNNVNFGQVSEDLNWRKVMEEEMDSIKKTKLRF